MISEAMKLVEKDLESEEEQSYNSRRVQEGAISTHSEVGQDDIANNEAVAGTINKEICQMDGERRRNTIAFCYKL